MAEVGVSTFESGANLKLISKNLRPLFKSVPDSVFVCVGDKGRDQVVILHHMLSKSQVKARPTVLWCYKKELDFSSHRKKRMKQIQKKIKCGKLDVQYYPKYG